MDGATHAKDGQSPGRAAGVRQTVLLPKSTGDSQPRERRLPAGSLHAVTGRTRREELREPRVKSSAKWRKKDLNATLYFTLGKTLQSKAVKVFTNITAGFSGSQKRSNLRSYFRFGYRSTG